MKQYIFGEKNGIYIVDLEKTSDLLTKACNFIRGIAAQGLPILYVGTKPVAQAVVEEEAKRAGMPFVDQRWLGGMMTNFITIRKRIGLLDQLEARQLAGDFDRLPKKEAALLTEELNKLADDAPNRIGEAAVVLRDVGTGLINSIFAGFTIFVLSIFMVARGRHWIDAGLRLRGGTSSEAIGAAPHLERAFAP